MDPVNGSQKYNKEPARGHEGSIRRETAISLVYNYQGWLNYTSLPAMRLVTLQRKGALGRLMGGFPTGLNMGQSNSRGVMAFLKRRITLLCWRKKEDWYSSIFQYL